MSESIFAKGKLFELVHLEQPDGRVFEVARRAPGVRLIITNSAEKTVLLTKEFRRELNAWDYRLPGGKVFDTLDEYEVFRASGDDLVTAATRKAKAEAIEEAGVAIAGLKYFKKSTLGATVEWDLLVFETTDWNLADDGQQLERGEQIEAESWFSYEDAKEMILKGGMQEERVALILLQWLATRGGGNNEV